MGVQIGNEETEELNNARGEEGQTISSPKIRKSRPKPQWTITIHAGLFRKNFKFKVSAHKWFTAANKAILAFWRARKEMPKKMTITIKRG